MHLAKYLAHAGAASRRGAVELVRAGRIRVDGVRELDPARRLDGERVELDGRLVAGAEPVPDANQRRNGDRTAGLHLHWSGRDQRIGYAADRSRGDFGWEQLRSPRRTRLDSARCRDLVGCVHDDGDARQRRPRRHHLE